MALNEKQVRFVLEYLLDLNATQAAIRAGYSPKTAYSQGQRLLKNVEVQEALQLAMRERGKQSKISGLHILEELAKIGFSNASDALGAEMKVSSKLKALELLGKHLGVFETKAEKTEQMGGVIVLPEILEGEAQADAD